MKRDEEDDLIIEKPITIKELYELACKEGIENRFLNVKIEREGQNNVLSENTYMRFGKWWSKDAALITLKEFKFIEENIGTCPEN